MKIYRCLNSSHDENLLYEIGMFYEGIRTFYFDDKKYLEIMVPGFGKVIGPREDFEAVLLPEDDFWNPYELNPQRH